MAARIAELNAEQITTLISEVKGRLRRSLRGHDPAQDADDFLQDAFVGAIRTEEEEDIEDIIALMTTVGTRAARNSRRKRIRREPIIFKVAQAESRDADYFFRDVELEALSHALDMAAKELKASERVTLELFREGHSQARIAELLFLPAYAVSRRLQRAFKQLRPLLKGW